MKARPSRSSKKAIECLLRLSVGAGLAGSLHGTLNTNNIELLERLTDDNSRSKFFKRSGSNRCSWRASLQKTLDVGRQENVRAQFNLLLEEKKNLDELEALVKAHQWLITDKHQRVRSALEGALLRKDWDILRILLPYLPRQGLGTVRTPLHFLAQSPALPPTSRVTREFLQWCVNRLVEKGVNINATDADGMTALDLAREAKRVRKYKEADVLVDILRSEGAKTSDELHGLGYTEQDPDTSPPPAPWLGLNAKELLNSLVKTTDVAQYDQHNVFKRLLTHSRDPDNDLAALVYQSPSPKSTQKMSLLLRRYPSLVNKRIGVSTPLYHLISQERWRDVVLLLKRGADTAAVDRFGRNVLHALAKVRGTSEHYSFDLINRLATYMMLKGALPCVKDAFGQTPYDIASKSSSLPVRNDLLSVLKTLALHAPRQDVSVSPAGGSRNVSAVL